MNEQRDPHPLADVIMAWASGVAIQFRNAHDDKWYDWSVDAWCSTPHFEARDTEWRVKPRLASLNGHEFPAPEDLALAKGTKYWMPRTNGDSAVAIPSLWDDDDTDRARLRHRRVHLSYEAAKAHARAEILAVGGAA